MIAKHVSKCANTLRFFLSFAGLIIATVFPISALQAPDAATAIVGATVIDGNGGVPLSDATIVIERGRITQIGPQTKVRVP